VAKPIDLAERIEVKSRTELCDWLAAHHRQAETVWLVTHKRHKPHYLSFGDIVDELLCVGWIDSRVRRIDEDRVERLISPRRPDSIWSLPNKARVEKLRAEGRMTPAGERAVRVAVENGMWGFLDDIEAQVVPDDFGAELAAARAGKGWNDLTDGERKWLLYWIESARTAKTRTKRVAAAAAAAASWKLPPPLGDSQ